MKKRISGLLAALALCLALLPGAALAAEGVEVKTDGTTFEAGKMYVPDDAYIVKVWEEDSGEERGNDYLEYDGTTLTVHGEMSLTNLYVAGNAAITGDAGSHLELKNGILLTDSTLTLDGGVGLTITKSLSADSSASTVVNKFVTTSDYSGNIAIQGGSYDVVLDVENSASIAITDVVTFRSDPPTDPMTLKSTGDISLTDGMFDYPSVILEGKRVSLSSSTPVFQGSSLTIKAEETVTVESTNAPAILGSAVISAGGTVVISSAGAPVTAPDGGTGGLTVKNASKVFIDGASDPDTPVISVPATFENCKEVTITKNGEGTVIEEDLVTTDTPVILEVGGGDYIYALVPGRGIWEYGVYNFGYKDLSTLSGRTCYKVNEGWAYYEPPAAEGGAATLTLENVTYMNDVKCGTRETRIVAKGSNTIEFIKSVGPVTVDQTGGKLNAIVTIIDEDDAEVGSSTVYGDAVLKDDDLEVSEEKTLTIPSGTSLTIDEESALEIENTANLTIGEGAKIINDGKVKLRIDPDDLGDIPTYIKSLNLTGDGNVILQKEKDFVYETVATYTNSGVKLLEPAERPDLSAAIPTEEKNAETWEKYGYKWEVLEKEDDTNKIRKATLTLAEGFNAEEVTLPGDGAEVTVKTEGDSLIGELKYKGADASTSIKLTFEGGKLAVAEHINFSGDVASSVTIANGAVVEANKGITVSAAAGVDGTVTVNGTLTARGERGGAAVLTGKVSVGPSGKLEVYGETGVFLGGKSTDDVNKTDFTDAFVLSPGGRFTGSCEIDIIAAQRNNGGKIEESLRAEDAIVIPNGYLPQGLAPVFNGDRTKLSIPGGGGAFNISSDNLPRPSGHTHKWAEGWTTSATHHWHNCTASGCPVTADSEKNGYGQHAYDGGWDADCNVCGYRRSLPSSDSSGSSGSSSHGGGGGSRPTSPITVEPSEHGTVTSDRSGAVYGGPVTLTVRPDSGYELESLTVTDRQGTKMKLSALGGGKYAFTMPGGAVTVRAAFTALEEENCPSRAFPDLDTGAWYHEAVDYVLSEGLMNGYADGTFRPNSALTRAQFVQILYNQAGRPAVTGRAPFTDVAPDAWCAPAVAWAAERGIAGGYGGGRFGPDEPVTREQLAVMLWRYAGSPAAAGQELDFSDADRAGGYAQEALRWAVEKGVMNGKTGGVLDPKGLATRAQAAQMLRNFMENG